MNKIHYLIAVLFMFLAGCNQKGTETIDHHEDEVKIQLTAYSNDFELFAEADPFIMGRSSGILSHFSHLPDFKALEKGRVTARLIVGDKEVSQTLEQPTRKGIYQFNLQPLVAGDGMLVFDFDIDQLQYRLEVPGILVFTDEEKAHAAAESQAVSQANSIVFTKEQSWKIEFATDLPETGPFGQVIKTSAMLQSAPDDEMVISSKAGGIVIFSDNSIVEGKSVASGEVLFTVSGSGMADNNLSVRLQEAENNYEMTRLEYERKQELAKEKIVSGKDLLAAKNDYDNARALHEMLSKNFIDGKQMVHSPIDGFIRHMYVTNGEFIEAGQPVFSVSKNKTLLLKSEVQQKYAPSLGSVYTANIRTVQDGRIYTLEELKGKILSYGRNAGDGNYLIPFSLQIENPGYFITGNFVEVYLKARTSDNAITVPNSSILEDQGNYYVFVQVHPELFEKREVVTGATDGIRTEILQGITEDDRIITTGAVFVKLSQASGALDAHSGHVH